jgi:tRNA(Ile)-lysidine synthase
LLRRKAPAADATISSARIDALFAPFVHARRLLLAVSGGPDSTALLLLAARWASQDGRPPIEVASVDHAMRPDSRVEAEAVAAISARLGLPHHLLEWRGPKPGSRIQERARDARYQLLAACAQEIGAEFLLTAHHADDQAETVLFRLVRGSGIGGLRGMESFAARQNVTLARPLLGLRKADLVAFCAACGADYARDPSNADPRFARTHLRRLADLLAAEGLGVDEIVRLSRRAARMEDAVAAEAKTAAVRLGWIKAQATRDAQALLNEPLEIVQRLLTAEIARVAGKTRRQVRLDAIETLAQALRAARAQGDAMRANVGGASVHMSAKGALTISREAPRRARVEPSAHHTVPSDEIDDASAIPSSLAAPG